MRVSPKRLEADYQLIEAAVIAGKRCPQGAPHGPLHYASIPELIETGRVRSAVYRHNWRVVTLLKGDHAGKTTAPAEEGLKPYLVNGVHVRKLAARSGKVAP